MEQRTLYDGIIGLVNGDEEFEIERDAMTNPISGFEIMAESAGILAGYLFYAMKTENIIDFKNEYESLNTITDVEDFVYRLSPMLSSVMSELMSQPLDE